MADISQMLTTAAKIKTATVVGDNTAERVGGLFEDVINTLPMSVINAAGIFTPTGAEVMSNPYAAIQKALKVKTIPVVRLSLNDSENTAQNYFLMNTAYLNGQTVYFGESVTYGRRMVLTAMSDEVNISFFEL